MKEQILEIYNLGLEKYAGDTQKAKEFTVGFLKEANTIPIGEVFKRGMHQGAGQAIGAGAAGLAIALGIHGMSSAMNTFGKGHLREKFEESLRQIRTSHPILQHADPAKVTSYAETVFKFAPHVACDPNLLGPILANAIDGLGLDSVTIRSLADLENRIQETRKNALFTPKTYG